MKVDTLPWLLLVFFLSSPGEGGEFVGWQGRQSPTVSTSLSLPWGWALQSGFFLSVVCLVWLSFLSCLISMWLEAICVLLLVWIHGCTWNLNESLILQIAQKNLIMSEWKGWLKVAAPYSSNLAFVTAKFYVYIWRPANSNVVRNFQIKVMWSVLQAAS
jgi:hypothetical protein